MVIGLQHVLLLPDGNRRYAIKHRMTYREGYDLYFQKILEFSKYLLINKDIKEVSVGALYHYNFTQIPKRTGIDDVYDAAIDGLRNIAEDKELEKEKINIRFYGELEEFYKFKPEFKELIESCKKERGGEKVLNILFPYSGQKEFARISKKLISEGKSELLYADITDNMFSPNEIGLIITCGQINYPDQPFAYATTCMPFLNAYRARFATLPKLLPEITNDEIGLCIDGYRKMLDVLSVRTYPDDPTQPFDFK